MKKRSARVSEAQWNIILDFLDRNPSLAKSRSYNNSAKGRAQATQLWQEVADELNAEGSGTYKTPKDWSIYVSNYKSKLKKIVAGINADVSGTGGRFPQGGSLTHIDTRFLAIMDQGCAQTAPDVSVKAFPKSYSPTPIPFHGTEGVIIFPDMELVKPEPEPEPNSPDPDDHGAREADVASKDRKEQSKLKRIVAGINADVSGTGGRSPQGGSLTHIDTRFLAIMDQGCAQTAPDVSFKAFPKSYSPTPTPFHGTEEVIIFPEAVKLEPNSPAPVDEGAREADVFASKDRKEPEPSLPRRTRPQRYRKRPVAPLVEACRILQKVELQRSAAELRNAEALNLIGQNIGRLADVLERFLARDKS